LRKQFLVVLKERVKSCMKRALLLRQWGQVLYLVKHSTRRKRGSGLHILTKLQFFLIRFSQLRQFKPVIEESLQVIDLRDRELYT
jgi:hypothetical protein